jgi:hypothetical protein
MIAQNGNHIAWARGDLQDSQLLLGEPWYLSNVARLDIAFQARRSIQQTGSMIVSPAIHLAIFCIHT